MLIITGALLTLTSYSCIIYSVIYAKATNVVASMWAVLTSFPWCLITTLSRNLWQDSINLTYVMLGFVVPVGASLSQAAIIAIATRPWKQKPVTVGRAVYRLFVLYLLIDFGFLGLLETINKPTIQDLFGYIVIVCYFFFKNKLPPQKPTAFLSKQFIVGLFSIIFVGFALYWAWCTILDLC